MDVEDIVGYDNLLTVLERLYSAKWVEVISATVEFSECLPLVLDCPDIDTVNGSGDGGRIGNLAEEQAVVEDYIDLVVSVLEIDLGED